MFVRNRWDSYTSSPSNKDGKMVHFGFCAELSRHSASVAVLLCCCVADITLPLPLEHHPTLGHAFSFPLRADGDQWLDFLKVVCLVFWSGVAKARLVSKSNQWCEETAIADYIFPKHFHFLRDKYGIIFNPYTSLCKPTSVNLFFYVHESNW